MGWVVGVALVASVIAGLVFSARLLLKAAGARGLAAHHDVRAFGALPPIYPVGALGEVRPDGDLGDGSSPTETVS